MEEPNGYELILRNAGGNFNDFAKPGEDSDQRNWFHALREPSSYYEFLTDNSALVQKAPTHVFDSISAPVKILVQSHSSLTQELSGSTSNVLRSSHRRRKASVSVNVTRQMASSTDSKRRERIAERVKALQELLANPVEGSQMAVMDEIIGYVKHLQQQMKELSKAKLGGEFRSCPNIFNEGNQHYEQTMKEPLEVTFAKLLKVDASAAIMFLESKGLFVRPLRMADRLQ